MANTPDDKRTVTASPSRLVKRVSPVSLLELLADRMEISTLVDQAELRRLAGPNPRGWVLISSSLARLIAYELASPRVPRRRAPARSRAGRRRSSEQWRLDRGRAQRGARHDGDVGDAGVAGQSAQRP